LKGDDDSLTFDPDEMGKAAVVLASDDSSCVAGVERFAGGGQSPVGSGRRAGGRRVGSPRRRSGCGVNFLSFFSGHDAPDQFAGRDAPDLLVQQYVGAAQRAEHPLRLEGGVEAAMVVAAVGALGHAPT
jgi:hypothetical protein